MATSPDLQPAHADGDELDPSQDLAALIAADVLTLASEELTAKVPRATYRLQFHAGFTFRDAIAIVPYLAKLGIGALYASPIFRARAGSTHGYDVVDYGSLNPELGSAEDFAGLVSALRAHSMGLVLDFVPNHMGIGSANPWWLDLVENGPSSQYAATFDVDWEPVKPELRDKTLIPLLGDHYGVVLENGELRLRFNADQGSFWLDYYDNPFPLAPPSYPRILRGCLETVAASAPPDDPDLLELESIVIALERLPVAADGDTEILGVRAREQVVAKRRLAELTARSEPIREAIASSVAELNGQVGDPRSFDPLDRLLEVQAFRLAFWRVAAEEINYRRFFAINELAAIRQEEPTVFSATHGLLLNLLAHGEATGVRVDHPDGLWDPAGYAAQLQRAYVLARCRLAFDQLAPTSDEGETGPTWEAVARALDEQWDALPTTPLYLLYEKILEPGEELPPTWPIHGTTGYMFANVATALFVDPAGRKPFDDLYATFIGEKARFQDIVYACKHLIMRVALASEVAVLANALDRITEHTRRSRDFTLNNLRDALREIIACFPVYRTYLVCDRDGDEPPGDERDRRSIETAIREARKRNPAVDPFVYDFIRDVILQNPPPEATPAQRAERCRFAMKFQQLSGPVMAKGLEDTAFYRYNRLAALNEVGGDPALFGIAPAAFHRQNQERRRRWPHAMLTSSTHDTKRSEDVRARLAVLSEIPREWRAALGRWTRLNRRHKTRLDGASAPDRNDEYLLYQTLLGAWPFATEPGDDGANDQFIDRIEAYVLKAQREAQVHTTWVNPNRDYETATQRFVRSILAPGPFLDDLAVLRRKIAHCGAFTSLGMQLLKLTAPGVPDLYQGTELWDFSLVDPDNRRPVDFSLRQTLLEELASSPNMNDLADGLVADIASGCIKLFLTQATLSLRAAHPLLFSEGDYNPLTASGPFQEHVFAFARRHGNDELIVIVPRLIYGLLKGEQAPPLGESVWGETTLALPADRTFRNVFTGGHVEGPNARLGDILSRFPVALLIGTEQ